MSALYSNLLQTSIEQAQRVLIENNAHEIEFLRIKSDSMHDHGREYESKTNTMFTNLVVDIGKLQNRLRIHEADYKEINRRLDERTKPEPQARVTTPVYPQQQQQQHTGRNSSSSSVSESRSAVL